MGFRADIDTPELSIIWDSTVFVGFITEIHPDTLLVAKYFFFVDCTLLVCFYVEIVCMSRTDYTDYTMKLRCLAECSAVFVKLGEL